MAGVGCQVVALGIGDAGERRLGIEARLWEHGAQQQDDLGQGEGTWWIGWQGGWEVWRRQTVQADDRVGDLERRWLAGRLL